MNNGKATKNILMIGASLKQRGGIASVENVILKCSLRDIKIKHITSHDEGSILYRIAVFLRAFILLLISLSIDSIDIVHLHISERGSTLRKIILAVICFLFRKPVFLHTHGAEFHQFYKNLNEYSRKIVSLVFRQCHYIIVLSNKLKVYYVKELGLIDQRVVVLYNPVVLPASFPDRYGHTKTTFLFIGRIGYRKGAFDLIKAFKKLTKEERKQAEIILAGDGETEYAEILIKRLYLTDKVKLMGWIDKEKRDKLLAKSDVFILPSYNEGMPMALLEAMGWGLPVITTPVGGIPDFVFSNKNGLLICPGNIDQIKETMKTLIRDKGLRTKLGNAARITVKRFDAFTYCQSLGGLYHSIDSLKM